MASNELAFLVLVVVAFTIFGGVLGFASWQETRASRRSPK